MHHVRVNSALETMLVETDRPGPRTRPVPVPRHTHPNPACRPTGLARRRLNRSLLQSERRRWRNPPRPRRPPTLERRAVLQRKSDRRQVLYLPRGARLAIKRGSTVPLSQLRAPSLQQLYPRGIQQHEILPPVPRPHHRLLPTAEPHRRPLQTIYHALLRPQHRLCTRRANASSRSLHPDPSPLSLASM